MTYNRINLMIPTYKRVVSGMLPDCIRSFANTASRMQNICFTFLVNPKDMETLEFFREATRWAMEVDILYAEYDKPHIGWFYNQLFERTRFQDEETLVTLIGDDMVCQTQGWDLRILEAANEMDGMGIVHCRDGIQNGQIGVNLFTTRKWVRATGGIFMEDFPADFIDVIYTEAARRTGHETYLGDVYIEHRHSSLKPKEQWDDGFKALRAEWAKYGPEVTARAEACIARQVTAILEPAA